MDAKGDGLSARATPQYHLDDELAARITEWEGSCSHVPYSARAARIMPQPHPPGLR